MNTYEITLERHSDLRTYFFKFYVFADSQEEAEEIALHEMNSRYAFYDQLVFTPWKIYNVTLHSNAFDYFINQK